MNLPSTHGNFPAQRHQPVHDSWPVLQHLEGGREALNVVEGLRAVNGNRPRLRTRHDLQVLPQDLAADADRFRRSEGARQAGPGCFVLRRLQDARIYQHVGVHEHRAG